MHRKKVLQRERERERGILPQSERQPRKGALRPQAEKNRAHQKIKKQPSVDVGGDASASTSASASASNGPTRMDAIEASLRSLDAKADRITDYLKTLNGNLEALLKSVRPQEAPAPTYSCSSVEVDDEYDDDRVDAHYQDEDDEDEDEDYGFEAFKDLRPQGARGGDRVPRHTALPSSMKKKKKKKYLTEAEEHRRDMWKTAIGFFTKENARFLLGDVIDPADMTDDSEDDEEEQ